MASAFYPVGRYRCRLGKHALIEKPKGPQLTIRFQVLGAYDQSGEVQSVQSYERTYYRVINENTGQYAIEDLKNMGCSVSSFAALDPEDPNGFSFDGIEADMWCSHENTDDGGTKEKWGVARQGGSTEIEGKRADRASLRKLDNLFGKALKGNGAAPKLAPGPQPLPAGGIDDSDIPFAPYDVPCL